MIQRRQFIAGMAAAATCSAVPGLRAADPFDNFNDKINWTARMVQTRPSKRSNRPPVLTGVCIQPNGATIACVGDDHIVSLYDLNKSTFTHHLAKHEDWVRCVRFSPDGQMMATCGNDRSIVTWRMNNLGEPQLLAQHDHAVVSIAFDPRGHRLAAVGFQHDLFVYDLQRRTRIDQYSCPCPDMRSVVYSPSGRQLVAGGRNGVIRVWNTDSGVQTAEVKSHRKRIRAIQFVDENRIASCGDDGIVAITNLAEPEKPQLLPRHASKLYAIQILPEDQLVTSGSDNKLYVWDLVNVTLLGTLSGHTGTVSSLDYQNYLLVSASYDTSMRIWSTQKVAQLDAGGSFRR